MGRFFELSSINAHWTTTIVAVTFGAFTASYGLWFFQLNGLSSLFGILFAIPGNILGSIAVNLLREKLSKATKMKL